MENTEPRRFFIKHCLSREKVQNRNGNISKWYITKSVSNYTDISKKFYLFMQGKIKFNNCARPKKLQNQSQSFFSKCLYVNLKLYELDSYDDDIVRGHLIRHHFMSKYGLLTPYKPQKFLNKQKSYPPTFQIS